VIHDEHLMKLVQLDRDLQMLPEVSFQAGNRGYGAERGAGQNDLVVFSLHVVAIHIGNDTVDQSEVDAAQQQDIRLGPDRRSGEGQAKQRGTYSQARDFEETAPSRSPGIALQLQ
jgi:hypothetical protein